MCCQQQIQKPCPCTKSGFPLKPFIVRQGRAEPAPRPFNMGTGWAFLHSRINALLYRVQELEAKLEKRGKRHAKKSR